LRISVIIISIFIIGLIVSVFYGLVTDLADDEAYNVNVDTSYKSTFDATSTMSNKISSKYNDMVNWSIQNKETTQLALIPDAISLVLSVIATPFAVLFDLGNSIIIIFKLPAWATTFISGVIVVILMFAFIALVLRFKET